MPLKHYATGLVSRFREGDLLASAQIDEIYSDVVVLKETLRWVRRFLAEPNEKLGRRGSVCPFIPGALKKGTLWLEVIRTPEPTVRQMSELVKKFADLFLAQPPLEGPDAEYKSIMLVFPDILPEHATLLIDGTQREMKPYFVHHGLMLGEFHKLNPTCGLHNKEFFPLRTPYPTLAIRYMVDSDLPFLILPEYPPALRIDFIRTWMGPRPGGHNPVLKRKAEEALQQALAEQE